MSDIFDPNQLTLEEACALLHGKDFWRLNGVERLSLPVMKVSDGPNGARGQDWVGGVTSACFPAGVCVAASFNPATAYKIGEGLAKECRNKFASALLGPTANIHRSPLGGRNFESYSEDPVLSGHMVSGYINGLQADGDITAVMKHFVCNDSETDRRTVDVVVEEGPLREIYLRPFAIAFARARPHGIMTSYNKLNGMYVGEQKRLLNDLIRNEWGIDDVMIVSDWWAVYSLAPAVLAGLDLEMPDSFFRGDGKLLAAAQLDDALAMAVKKCAGNVLQFIKRSGGLDVPVEEDERAEDLPETRQLIRDAGAEGIVLLKNAGVLPLSPSSSIAVSGLFATVPSAHGGGSAALDSHYKISPAQGLTTCFKDVQVTSGVPSHLYPPLPLPGVASIDGHDGCLVEFFQPDGTLVESRKLGTTWLTCLDRYPEELVSGWTAKMSFDLSPASSGSHTLSLATPSLAKLFVNGKQVVQNDTDARGRNSFMQIAMHECSTEVSYEFEAGRAYKVEISVESTGEVFFATAAPLNGIRFGFQEQVDEDLIIADAVRAAEKAGVAIVCVGHSPSYETEGFDRKTLSLLGAQDRLVTALAASSAKVVVAIYTGSPVTMPWLDKVDAVVQCWYPGQEVGNSLADVLSGAVNPSGRLPVTFPLQIEDTPSFGNFPGEKERVEYQERLFVGYRHYSSKRVPTLFPFGFGLSYSSFSVHSLVVRGVDSFGTGKSLSVAATVTNTGASAGRHTVLLFVTPPTSSSSPSRPAFSLEAFGKTELLKPGETETVEMDLRGDAFSCWVGGVDGHWEVKAGVYGVQIRADAESEPLEEVRVNIKSGWTWRKLEA